MCDKTAYRKDCADKDNKQLEDKDYAAKVHFAQYREYSSRQGMSLEEVEKEHDIVKSPFSDEQVKSLNAYQKSGMWHPYTCGNDHKKLGLSRRDEDTILVADRYGWHCPVCSYLQNWAHTFTADWSWDIGATDKERRKNANIKSDNTILSDSVR